MKNWYKYLTITCHEGLTMIATNSSEAPAQGAGIAPAQSEKMSASRDKSDKPAQRPALKTSLRENTEAIVVALILALFVRTFIFQAFKIPSGSMKDTLLVGDHILVNKFIYEKPLPWLGVSLFPLSEPERRDILVFKYPKEPERDFIKRCIAKGNDTFMIRGDEIRINNIVQNEPFIKKSERQLHKSRYRYGPQKIPENHYFMMGDNRNNSEDSRYWGTLEHNLIKGKAFLIYLSIDDKKAPLLQKIRWNRFFKIIR